MALFFEKEAKKVPLLKFAEKLFNESNEMTEDDLIKELNKIEPSRDKIKKTLPKIVSSLGLERVYRLKRKI